MYQPIEGRWMQQDPAGYVDGLDLYQMERSSPATYVDPLGFAGGEPQEVGVIGGTGIITGGNNNFTGGGPTHVGPTTNPSGGWMDAGGGGPTTRSSGENEPVIQVVQGYIKGDPIWGWKPAHTYIMIDGVGYGKYAAANAGGPPDSCGGVGAIATNGVIKSGDETKYPVVADPTTVPVGRPYGIARIQDQNGLQGRKIKKLVLDQVNKPQFYSAAINNCDDWVAEVIGTFYNPDDPSQSLPFEPIYP